MSEKKRESRKSGFFNLIKSRTSRSEKSHGAASITPTHPTPSPTAAPTSSISTVTEESSPTSPTPPVKHTVAVVEQQQESNQDHSQDNTESERSPAAAEPAVEEKDEENPHVPRHIGVPVMGLDLLAEMKARQERMAAQKVGQTRYIMIIFIIIRTESCTQKVFKQVEELMIRWKQFVNKSLKVLSISMATYGYRVHPGFYVKHCSRPL